MPLVLIICLFILSNYLFLYPSIKENIINEKKIMIKELTNVTLNIIENLYATNKNKLTESEIKKLAIEQIRNINYGEDKKSYFWIIDLTPKMIMHPYRQDLEGTTLSNYKDINGVELFNNAVALVNKKGDGYIEYYWQWHDDSTKMLPKITYVKLFKEWGWIVGTGMYIDDLDTELSKFRNNEIKTTLVISLLILIFIFSVLFNSIKIEKQRINSQKKLLASEEKFRNLFQNSNDIIIVSTLEGVILDVNEKALSTYGLKYEDVLGKTTFEMMPEKYHEKIKVRIQSIGKIELEPLEVELTPTMNQKFTVEVKSNLLTYEGNTVLMSTMRDITERKIHEKKLLESYLHYKIVADYNSGWEYWLGKDNQFIYMSPSCLKFTGYEPAEFKSNPKLFTDIIIEEDQEKWASHLKNSLENRMGNEMIVFRILHKTGNIVWIEHTCQPVYDNFNNFIGIRGSNHNITYRKEIEKMLIETNKSLEVSKAKFKNLSNLTFEGIALHDNGVVIDVNLSLVNMFGFTREELINKNVLSIMFDAEYQDIIKLNIESNYTDPYEVVGLKKDGTKFPVEIVGKNYQTEVSGNPLRVTAFRDISIRKKAENEVRKLSMAVEQSANLVLITDKKGSIEYANETFYKTTGFTKAEVIGKNPRILSSGKQDKRFYKNLWSTILSGNVWRGEICNKKKNGDLYWESTLITPVFDDNNQITNFMSVKENITHKKLADIKLFNTIIETEEKERKKFAEDLHDELGPHLSGIRLYINELEDENIRPERRVDIVRMLDILIMEAIDKTRSISNQLMPSVLVDYGLMKALNSFCSRINSTGKIKIKLTCNVDDLLLDKTTEIVVYRIIIELINNTIKHANAENIGITCNKNNENLELVYEDDGQGFDFENALKNKNGLGLNNIINRIKTLEGSYNFENNLKKGVIFSFTFLPKQNFLHDN
jgi:PAS domain S-box-containing protein